MADIRSIDNETMIQITEFETYGTQILSLEGNEDPKTIVSKINKFVADAKERNQALSEDQRLGLGVLLGYQYVNGLNWHWGEVIWDGDEAAAAIGVLNEDNSLFNSPMSWIHQVLNSNKTTNFMLNYNMVAGNSVPTAKPNEAIVFH